MAEIKLWCCMERCLEDTNWDMGYFAQVLFPFLKAIGNSSELSKGLCRESGIGVLTSGSGNWSCFWTKSGFFLR